MTVLLRLAVIGAGGRLGKLVVAEAARATFDVVAIGRHDDLATLLPGVAAVVDVATPGGTARHAAVCAAAGVPLVVATTGLVGDDHRALDDAAAAIPVLVAANLSPGAHLVALLSAMAAKAMPDADVEIVEVHHRNKKDAPSGTALMLAQAVEHTRGGARVVAAREGHAPRAPGDIGVLAVRGGDVVGEHTVCFFVDGERVEIAHKVSDRAIFATGAVRAARFLVGKAPGRYRMTDVLQAGLG